MLDLFNHTTMETDVIDGIIKLTLISELRDKTIDKVIE
jgi:hypothetical protein